MGNYNTIGAARTSSCSKLDLRLMLRYGQIKNGYRITGTIEWTFGGSASYISDCTTTNKFLRMMYTYKNRNGETIEMDYCITIDTFPSNLGKGELLYFICPKSNKRAMVLYDAYGSKIYAHRDWYKEAYGMRILYNSQQTSKQWYANTRYFNTKREVDNLKEEIVGKKYKKVVYNGLPTKDFKKLYKLTNRMHRLNIERCNAFSSICRTEFDFKRNDV